LILLAAQEDLARISHRLQGRWIARRIDTGMTRAEVDQIVGRRGYPAAGSATGFIDCYGDYDFLVTFTRDDDGGYTVREVDFAPLIGKREFRAIFRKLSLGLIFPN
jgi:hypothetical protein